MVKSNFNYLFGPVPFRRLGVSLGVDMIPHKTCTLNCVYCESGRTSDLTVKREKYVPTKKVISELQQYLSTNPKLDYITFSGSGEPTLHAGIGEVIRFIKANYSQYKIALLTNGTLLHDRRVREEVKLVDLVCPSLDAASAKVFKKINRPAKQLNVKNVIEGLVEFRKMYSGKIWLEIFIVPGVNDTEDEIALLREAVHRIEPDKVQLNTLDRPGTDDWVEPAKEVNLEKIAADLDWETEIIAKFPQRMHIASYHADTETAILQLIKRRPCTSDDIAMALDLNALEVNKYIDGLLAQSKIKSERMERGVFFKPASDA